MENFKQPEIPAEAESAKWEPAPDTLGAYRNDVDTLFNQVGRLSGMLRDREDEGFAELIEESALSRIFSVMRQIRDTELKQDKDLQELGGYFAWMTGKMRELGETRSRNVKESVDSLKAVGHALNMIAESAGDVARDLKRMGTPEAEETSADVLRFANAALDGRSAIWRRLNQIENR